MVSHFHVLMVIHINYMATDYDNIFLVISVRFLVPALLNKLQGTFLERNDPKMRALMQQAELLGSLALKVNMDSSNQNLESVWKVNRRH